MATTVSSSGVSTSVKRCMKCGKDVNGQRRMKDPKGNYWCYDCGSQDEVAKGSGTLVQPCPVCKKPIHAMNMVRNKKSGLYTCDECSASGKGNAGSGDPKKKKLIIVVVALALLGAVAYYLNMPA
jgi:ribosomal protein L37AE/L43A